MGYRGFIRACAAYSRAQQAESIREQRRQAKERLLQAKEEYLQSVEEAVESYEAYIESISTLHTQAQEEMDWENLMTTPDPTEPKISRALSDKAVLQRMAYQPTLWDRLFFRVGKITEELDNSVRYARSKEKKEYEAAYMRWEEESKNVVWIRKLAKGILAKDESSWKEAVEKLVPLEEMAVIASTMNLRWEDCSSAVATLKIRDGEAVPDFVISQTARGKLSKKPMAKGKYWELYEDLVISAAIRTARECFAVLPFSSVTVVCEATLVDQATGKDVTGPILTVDYPREKFLALKFDRIDPSESLKGFKHKVAFKRGVGFTFVE